MAGHGGPAIGRVSHPQWDGCPIFSPVLTDEPVLHRIARGADAGRCPDLVVDMLQVMPDGCLAHAELLSDGPASHATGRETQDIDLAYGQLRLGRSGIDNLPDLRDRVGWKAGAPGMFPKLNGSWGGVTTPRASKGRDGPRERSWTRSPPGGPSC